MINDLDETIKKLLIRELKEFGMSFPDQYDISFDTPDGEWEKRIAKLTINLCLFDIAENHTLRSNEPIREVNPDRTVTIRKPPARFDCKYLVTTWGAATPPDTEQEHRLLGQVLWALFRHPQLPQELFHGYLAELESKPEIPAFAAQPNELEVVGQFWSSLENQWKASFNYVVTVPIDLAKPVLTWPMVTTKMPYYEPRDGSLDKPSK